jgi:hypothetical protein
MLAKAHRRQLKVKAQYNMVGELDALFVSSSTKAI